MKLNIKTIIGFVVIGVVAYLCRPLNDKIADVFIEDKNDVEEPEEIKISGNIEGHDYVDLGLSVKWATCNIGASKPEEYGDYFAWGETEPKYWYDQNNYSENFVDAAEAKWGGLWRMPTKEECDELKKKCSWEWTTINGKNGYKVKSKNGNWIFLPAAGFRYGALGRGAESYGCYWSSIVNKNSSNYAYYLYFVRGGKYTSSNYRDYGCSVRPVTE